MSSTGLIVLPLSTRQAPHSLNQETQRQTWGASIESEVLWVHGHQGLSEPRDLSGNLEVNCPESFSDIFRKTVLSLRYLLANREFEFVLRTNSSIYLNEQLLKDHCRNSAGSRTYFGLPAWWQAQDASGLASMFVSGAGVLLGRESVECLAEANPEDFALIPDDVAIGMVLLKNGFNLTSPRDARWSVDVTNGAPVAPAALTRVKSYESAALTRSRLRELHSLESAKTRDELASSLKAFDRREVRRQFRRSRSPFLAHALRERFEATRDLRLQLFERELAIG